jgi:hypothetical protein
MSLSIRSIPSSPAALRDTIRLWINVGGVILTGEGRSVYNEARWAVEEVEASFFSVLSHEERERLEEMPSRQMMAPHLDRPPASK